MIRPGISLLLASVFAWLLVIDASLARDQGAREDIEQKLALTRSYLDSAIAASITESGSGESRHLLDQAREYFEQANDALRDGHLLAAQDKVNLSLQSFTAAGAAKLKQAAASAHRENQNRSIRAEIDSYVESFRNVSAEKGSAAEAMLDDRRLSQLLTEAERSGGAGDHFGAASALREARQLVVDALIRIRNNETLVYTIEFKTPADEFHYEQERYREYASLGRQLIDAGEIEIWRVQKFLQVKSSADHLQEEARELLDDGNHEAAITRIETAVRQLVQGLQVLGINLAM